MKKNVRSSFNKFKEDFFEAFPKQTGSHESYRVGPDIVLRSGSKKPKTNLIIPPSLNINL